MTKLAIVSPFPPEISGVGQYGSRVAEGLAHSGHFEQMRVFANQTSNAPALEHHNGFVVQRAWRRNHLANAGILMRELRQWQPDAVWFNIGLASFGRTRLQNFLGLSAPLLTRSLGLPTVVTLHEIFEASNLRLLGAVNGRLTYLGGQVATRLLLQADIVCLTLRAYVQIFQKQYQAHNLAHVPHGAFDAPGFTPLPDEKRILMFAMHAPYKGLPELLDIFRQLRADDPSIRLTVAGSDHHRFPGYLNQVREALGESPGVEWRVGVPENEVPGLFASARVVALPCIATTGASSIIHRASAHGRPVLAYNHDDLRAVADEENLHVEFVPQGDRNAFARQLRDLLKDPARCETIGRENVAVMRTMTLAVTCQRYIQLFERATALNGVL
ncbi:MAG: glycosyltransferase family 4 protein [Chloroflexi bacterium]|nr:glycosyltransferase family 4 protein [Chloroflexota bacterium]